MDTDQPAVAEALRDIANELRMIREALEAQYENGEEDDDEEEEEDYDDEEEEDEEEEE